jgi:hypothetical protein
MVLRRKSLMKEHKWFACDSCNVRLSLASDGVNPFSNMSTTYNIWSIVLMLYNLSPWMCMMDPNLILSLLILGHTTPRNDSDVYLWPELWNEGVTTYNSSIKETF